MIVNPYVDGITLTNGKRIESGEIHEILYALKVVDGEAIYDRILDDGSDFEGFPEELTPEQYYEIAMNYEDYAARESDGMAWENECRAVKKVLEANGISIG